MNQLREELQRGHRAQRNGQPPAKADRDREDARDHRGSGGAQLGARVLASGTPRTAPRQAAATTRPVTMVQMGWSVAFALQMQRVEQLASECGMLGELGAAIADGFIGGAAEPGGGELLADLRKSLTKRVRETWDCNRLGTALEWFRDFLRATGRAPFMPLEHAADMHAARYNQDTLDLFAEYIRRKGSRQRHRLGTSLNSDTVDGYVSAIKILRSCEAHYVVTMQQVNMLAPAASKRTRQLQAPPGTRRLKRGIRAAMLRSLAAIGYDRSSARGMIEWAAALVAHNLLLRGGELGVVEGKQWDATRDASFGVIEFKAPCADSNHLPWLTWDVVPIKDVVARRRVCPMAVRRRQAGGAIGSDPLCTYDAVVLAWRASSGTEPPTLGRVEGALTDKPFFLSRSGAEWNTIDTRQLAQAMARALGLEPYEFGASSFRIGGATDWRDVFKADAERIITQRGRWHSDIAFIYQRALAEAHLSGSAAVGDAAGADLETLCKGWVQPASFR